MFSSLFSRFSTISIFLFRLLLSHRRSFDLSFVILHPVIMLVSASLAVGFASTAFAATTACRQWTTYDTMTKVCKFICDSPRSCSASLTLPSKFDSNVWTIETGSQNQLDYSKGFLNMSVSESSQNVVLSTKNTFLPPASFEVVSNLHCSVSHLCTPSLTCKLDIYAFKHGRNCFAFDLQT